MTTMNNQLEKSEADIFTLFRLRTELQKRARPILEEIKRIEQTITKIDAQRVQAAPHN